MALATTCPQCNTSFKVVPDQLKLRRGMVRCGVCQHVFSGIDHLRYVEDGARRRRRSADGGPPSTLIAAVDTVTGERVGEASPPAAAPPARVEQPPPAAPVSPPGLARPAAPDSAIDPGPATTAPSTLGASTMSPSTQGDMRTAFFLPETTFQPTTQVASPEARRGPSTVILPASLKRRTRDDDESVEAGPGHPHHEAAGPDPAETDPLVNMRIEALLSPTVPDAPELEPLASDADPASTGIGQAHHAFDQDDLSPPPAADVAVPSDADLDRVLADALGIDSSAPTAEPTSEPAPATEPAPTPRAAPTAEPGPTIASHQDLLDETGVPALEERMPAVPAADIPAHSAVADAATPATGPIAPPAATPATSPAAIRAAAHPPAVAEPPPARPAVAPVPPVPPAPPIEISAPLPPAPLPPPLSPPAAAPGGPTEDAIDYFSAADRSRRGFSNRLSPVATVAALLLVLLLIAQLGLIGRNWIAQSWPGGQATLARLLTPLNLHIAPPRDLASLTIESFELQAGDTPERLTMSALLRNHAAYDVQWPALELSLTDGEGALLARKVIVPEDYLRDGRPAPPAEAATPAAPGPEAASVIRAKAEQPLRLIFAATDLVPAGYSVVLFYP